MLIGICGYATSGKDTLAQMLIGEGLVGERYAFADPIKEMMNALFGWDERHAFGELKEVEVFVNVTINEFNDFKLLYENKYGLEELSGSNYSCFDAVQLLYKLCGIEFCDVTLTWIGTVTPRQIYQVFGTEVARENVHPDIWTLLAPTENVIIPDIRFHNEEKWVHDNDGIMIRIERKIDQHVRTHESEKYICVINCDVVVNNVGTVEDLHAGAPDLVRYIKRLLGDE